MIQANELRIGNWLMHQGKAKQVGSIHSDNTLRFILEDVRTEGCFSLGDVTGIPLTPEILEKLQFMKAGRTYKIVHNEWGNIFQLNEVDGKFEFTWGATPIPYVNTLQNIYHALTGQELIIQL